MRDFNPQYSCVGATTNGKTISYANRTVNIMLYCYLWTLVEKQRVENLSIHASRVRDPLNVILCYVLVICG